MDRLPVGRPTVVALVGMVTVSYGTTVSSWAWQADLAALSTFSPLLIRQVAAADGGNTRVCACVRFGFIYYKMLQYVKRSSGTVRACVCVCVPMWTVLLFIGL